MRITHSVVTNVVRIAALVAAMLISFAVERDLALSHGVPPMVAPAVPVAIDLFMIWAVRSRRDVAVAVAVAVAANIAGVLTTESLSDVNTWVSAGLHAVFPLTVWRMHRVPVTADSSADTAGHDFDPAAVASDLWRDFESSADSEADTAVTPPAPADIRTAMDVIASAKGRPVTGAMLADHFGVSERTGRRYLSMAAA